MRWAFFASCVLEGYECQSPGDSSELPGYLDSSPLPLENAIYTTTHICSSFRPPSNNVIPLASSTMETRLLRAEKVLSHQQGRPCVHALNESMRAKSRGGYLCGKVRVSIYPATRLFSRPLDKQKHPFSRHMRHLHAVARSCTAG